jgi:threonyl-tRNA synthetase
MLTRIYGTAWANQQADQPICTCWKKRKSAIIRKLGREMDLFHFQEEGPGSRVLARQGLALFQNLLAYMRRRIEDDYDEVNAPQVLENRSGKTSGHWGWYSREHVRGHLRRRGAGG